MASISVAPFDNRTEMTSPKSISKSRIRGQLHWMGVDLPGKSRAGSVGYMIDDYLYAIRVYPSTPPQCAHQLHPLPPVQPAVALLDPLTSQHPLHRGQHLRR